MTFKESIFTCLFKKSITFRGRASRSEFWWFYLFCLIILFPVICIDFLSTGRPGICMLITLCLIVIPLTAVCTRRLHDVGFRGWWQLLQFTGIGIWILIILYALPSRPSGDKYNINE